MAWEPQYRAAQNWGQVVKVFALALVLIILFAISFFLVRRDQAARQAASEAEQQEWVDPAR